MADLYHDMLRPTNASSENTLTAEKSLDMGDKSPQNSSGNMALAEKPLPTFATSDSEEFDAGFSRVSESKLVRRIDLRVLPCLCILWLLAFLDRVNIGNAVVFKLREDLKIASGNKYNTALVVFFIPYILFEIPGNILMRRFRPHRWLSACLFFTGLVACLQGVTISYSGLLTARFFLGLAECNLLPGAFYLIGTWYKRSEAQKRFSFLFNSASIAGAFGGLLAAAIGKMQGLRGYNGWRWLFILEGTLTALVAIVFYFTLPDFPDEASWLSDEERSFLRSRLAKNQGPCETKKLLSFRDVLSVFRDYKIIIAGVMYFGCIITTYGYAYFAPLIIRSYKYTPIRTQLLSVPPWAAAFAFAMILAWLSDRLRHRFLFAILPLMIAISGLITLLKVHNRRHVQYGALFLVTMGTFSAMPIIICWFNQNLGGHTRRSVGSAYQISFGNTGAFIAVYAFLQKDAPIYKPGYSICLAFMCLSAASCCIYALACWSQNKARLSQPETSDLSEEEKIALGDLSPEYRYML